MTIEYGAFLPESYLDLQYLMDYCFLEPMDSQRYRDFYRQWQREKNGDLVLDNGLIELGQSINGPKLAEYASYVEATWVIPPDKLGNWEFNITAAREFSRMWPKSQLLVALAGPQATDFDIQSSIVMGEGFGGICLPYRLNRCMPTHSHRIHLLGNKMPEQFYPYDEDGINDVTYDTVEPISAAMRGIAYQQVGIWTVKRPTNYFTQRLETDIYAVACRNIQLFKEWIVERTNEVPK